MTGIPLDYDRFTENYLQEFFDGNLHRELEKCDTLQGFNLVSDMESGWGGFSSALLVELRNELPKKAGSFHGDTMKMIHSQMTSL